MNLRQLTIVGSTLLFCFSGCKEKIKETEVGSCQLSGELSSKDHPKNEIYTEVLENHVRKGLPGLVMLVDKEGEDLWIGSAGVACIEKKIPMQPCNLFFSGGMGKLFTASATMYLIQEEKLSLKDKLAGILPIDIIEKMPNGRELTIGHLLSHTSGVKDFEEDQRFLMDILNNYSMDLSREIVLDRYVYNTKPLFAPGTKQQYSSSNYEILTLVLDLAAEKNHARLFSDRIIKELNLHHTFYRNESGYPKMEGKGLVNGYMDRMSADKLENVTDIMIDYADNLTGSRGVIGSVHDYYLFLKNTLEYNLLSEPIVRSMKSYPTDEYGLKKKLFGLGFMFRDTRHGPAIGHSGSTFGSAIEVWYFLDKKTYLVMATNISNFFDSPPQNIFDDKLWEEALYTIF